MRLIPEYEEVSKLYLSFVNEFFNTRFKYGKAFCDIVNAARNVVDIEIFTSQDDLPFLEQEFISNNVDIKNVVINFDSPGRGILAEYFPFFGIKDDKTGIGIIINNSSLDDHKKLRVFSERFLKNINIDSLELPGDFGTACISVSEDLCLLTEYHFKGDDSEDKLNFFKDHFPDQNFITIPTLKGDLTRDLDMFLWPIKPGVWIVSEYQKGSSQEISIEPAIEVLKKYNQEIHRVPGLEPIIYDDINTMPNYTNGLILNDIALCPAYNRDEDEIVVKILEQKGYKVYQIYCSDIILSNSAIHCLSKTIPEEIIRSNN